MKKKIFAVLVLVGFLFIKTNAQYVRAKPGFSVGVSIGAPGPAPFAGGIWIGPEWTWREGRYVEVPGYWARPRRHGAVWIPGHWKYGRRGYRWVPGHWR